MESKKSTLRGLATISFFAENLQEAKKWYSKFLGIEPYYAFPDQEQPAYIEFRLRDFEHELGIIDKKYQPSQASNKPGGQVAFWQVEASINLPNVELSETLSGEFDYIHLFTKRKREQQRIFPKLKKHLKLDGMLWVSWPKGGQLDTDLSLPKVIHTGYEFGLVESTCLSINSIWSALKFTHPKKGKTYNNSHAKLKSRTTNR